EARRGARPVDGRRARSAVACLVCAAPRAGRGEVRIDVGREARAAAVEAAPAFTACIERADELFDAALTGEVLAIERVGVAEGRRRDLRAGDERADPRETG